MRKAQHSLGLNAYRVASPLLESIDIVISTGKLSYMRKATKTSEGYLTFRLNENGFTYIACVKFRIERSKRTTKLVATKVTYTTDLFTIKYKLFHADSMSVLLLLENVLSDRLNGKTMEEYLFSKEEGE